MVRACVHDQLQNKHRLPRDLPLCYIEGKVMCQSNMNARRARFLLPARTRAGLGAFLYPSNITACGYNTTDPKPIRIPGVRARPTTYPGVSLSVSVSSGHRGTTSVPPKTRRMCSWILSLGSHIA